MVCFKSVLRFLGVSEGANMPTDLAGLKVFKESGICYAPGKASNAGGVAVSGLEMSQNSLRMSWTRERVEGELEAIMVRIHRSALEAAERYGQPGNYVYGANIAGFIKIAEAMMAQGVV